MKRISKIGLAAVLGIGLLAGASAYAFGGGHGAGHGFMKHFVSATIDQALDAANVTPQQRDAIHASRDRAFATVETHMKGERGKQMEEALQLFEADRVDTQRIAAMRAEKLAQMQQVGDAIQQAVIEAHDVLTPAQRKVVAEYVRSHRPGSEHGNAKGQCPHSEGAE